MRLKRRQRGIVRGLSIDGGGLRGYYAAHVLRLADEQLTLDLNKDFDIIVGTSTGAILAAALALGIRARDFAPLYEETCKKIFSPRLQSGAGFYKSLYAVAPLEETLRQLYGEATMRDVKTPLLIPATDIGNGRVYIFKSPYSDTVVRNADTPLVDAVLASCAAPRYFKPRYVDPHLLADGGMWANNPSLLALTELTVKMNIPLEQIRLMSVGTGLGRNFYPVRHRDKKWGLLTGWKIGSLFQMLLNLQSAHSHNIASLMLRKEHLVRINFYMVSMPKFDDPNMLDDLKSRAHIDFDRCLEDICAVLATEVQARDPALTDTA